jgi:hypothetical protein
MTYFIFLYYFLGFFKGGITGEEGEGVLDVIVIVVYKSD